MLIRRSMFLIICATLALVAALYFYSIDPNRFGFYHDDGIYVVTAKSLATGQGYRILSLPDQPWETKYPPVFPFALSALWQTNPVFPGNLLLFSLLSLISMLAFLGLSAGYLLKHGYLSKLEAFLVLLLAALNWRTAILATTILSDALYAALSVGVLWLTLSLDRRGVSLKGVALGLALTLAPLTRLSGLSLLLAMFLYALINRRLRSVGLPILIAFSAIAGWFWWCHVHQSPMVKSSEIYYVSYYRDWLKLLSEPQYVVTRSFWGPLISMVGKNLLALIANIPVLCLGVGMDWYAGMSEIMLTLSFLAGAFILYLLFAGFWKTRSLGNGLLHLYFLVYITVLLFWPYNLYDRFLIPLIPFILAFITVEIRYFLPGRTRLLSGRLLAKPLLLLLSCMFVPLILIVAAYRSTYGLCQKINISKQFYAEVARYDAEIVDWLMRNSNDSDVLMGYRDPVLYLFAHRKSVRTPNFENDDITGNADRLMRLVDENRVKYLIRTDSDFELDAQPALERRMLKDVLERNPESFVQVFDTRGPGGVVYRINSK